MQSFRIRYSIMKEPLFISSWQMLNHRDSTALSLLLHTGKGQLLVSSNVLVDTSYPKNLHFYSRKKEKLLITIFMALPQSSNNSNLQHSHISSFSYVFFPLHKFYTFKQAYFSLPQRKLIASKLWFVARQWANPFRQQTPILKCSGYRSFSCTDMTEANIQLLEEAGEKTLPLFNLTDTGSNCYLFKTSVQ